MLEQSLLTVVSSKEHISGFSALTLLLVLYVLSVGPAVRYSFGTRWFSAVEVIYGPVLALDRTPLRPVLWGYMRLWGFFPGGAFGWITCNG